MFVIRDWQELDDHDWGLDTTGKDSYLSGVLSCASNNKELTAIRTHLRDSFSDLKCFLMPHPGLKVSIWKPSNPFVGAIKGINLYYCQGWKWEVLKSISRGLYNDNSLRYQPRSRNPFLMFSNFFIAYLISNK